MISDLCRFYDKKFLESKGTEDLKKMYSSIGATRDGFANSAMNAMINNGDYVRISQSAFDMADEMLKESWIVKSFK